MIGLLVQQKKLSLCIIKHQQLIRTFSLQHIYHQKKEINKKISPDFSKVPQINFKPYFSKSDCDVLIEQGKLLKGPIQVFGRLDSFVRIGHGVKDLYIQGFESRNRALHGDIVAVQLLPDQKESIQQKKAEVVKIIDEKHPRIASGHVKAFHGHRYGFAIMSPTDTSLPIIMIPLKNFPKEFIDRPKDFEKSLFLAKITDWDSKLCYASGKLISLLGEAGSVDAETEAILKKNLICSSQFQRKVIKSLPEKNWKISTEELNKRIDLRKECIFTIDPLNARDLDDALSCKKIGDDLFEVGVHIADVSYFVKEGSPLDEVAQLRATSVYLSQKVIPMLPSVLSENLCSLNPGVDRLTYSVIWNMKSDGTVVNEQFCRTVICSQIKMTYNQAQQLIESTSSDTLNANEFPSVSGIFSIENVRDSLHILFKISKHLRKKRHDAGAMNYNLPELAFNLNEEKDKPISLSLYKYRDSNKLIEEFMLLANMAVAHKIFKAYPKKAILRRHPPPNPLMMEDLAKVFELYELDFDLSSSQSINKSLEKLSGLNTELQEYLESAVILMCTKTYLLASYFCSGTIENEKDFHHFGLNVPLYTHFTSPIRRYPDILVHRFLTAALDDTFVIRKSVDNLKSIAEHCNEKKYAAGKASEESSQLFFALFLLQSGPFQEKGVIVAVLNNRVDILCTRLGLMKRVYYQDLKLCEHKYELDDKMRPILTLHWREENQKGDEFYDNQKSQRSEINNKVQQLQMFSPVEVVLSVEKNHPTKVLLTLKNPLAEEITRLDL